MTGRLFLQMFRFARLDFQVLGNRQNVLDQPMIEIWDVRFDRERD